MVIVMTSEEVVKLKDKGLMDCCTDVSYNEAEYIEDDTIHESPHLKKEESFDFCDYRILDKIQQIEFSDVLNNIENKLGIQAISNENYEIGIKSFYSAALRNYKPAQYNLALCFEKGLGTEKNEKTAFKLYEVAASNGHPDALYNLAVFYGQGRGGLDIHEGIAERLLYLAAERGQEKAINVLERKTDGHKIKEENLIAF